MIERGSSEREGAVKSAACRHDGTPVTSSLCGQSGAALGSCCVRRQSSLVMGGACLLSVRVLFEHVEPPVPVTATTRLHRPEVDRSALRRLLLDSLQPGTVIWGQQLLRIDGCASQVRLQPANQGGRAAQRPRVHREGRHRPT